MKKTIPPGRGDSDACADCEEDQPECGPQLRPIEAGADGRDHHRAGKSSHRVDGEVGPDRFCSPEHAVQVCADGGHQQPGQEGRKDDRAKHGCGAAEEAASADRDDCIGQQERGHQQCGDDQRQMDQGAAGDVHEDPVAARLRRSVRERLCEREGLIAHMLEGCGIERRNVVAGAMVARLIADRREVEGQPAALGETVHVGIVGHQPIDVSRQRVGDRIANCGGEQGNRSRVRPAGLEHVHRSAHAARLEIDDRVDVTAERVGHEGACADQPQLFAFVEEQDDGPPWRLAFQDRADFEQRRDAYAVVTSAGPDWRAVVMGVQKQRPAAWWSERGNDVADAGAGHAALLVKLVAGELVADDGCQPDLLQLGDQAGADKVRCRRIGRVRPLVAED